MGYVAPGEKKNKISYSQCSEAETSTATLGICELLP
jgi:hypothetical protein